MNQLCKVCGEPAAGFHFGAFTCEGCKSFFGRTYNNISSISECKNNGECVINKKNRTACKACRLRKCLLVGMSKSGSRYGRRSNWFKIHCLLQEQQQHHHHHNNNNNHHHAGAANMAAAAAAAASLLRPHPYLSPLFRGTTATPTTAPSNARISSESDSGASSADLEDDARSVALSYAAKPSPASPSSSVDRDYFAALSKKSPPDADACFIDKRAASLITSKFIVGAALASSPAASPGGGVVPKWLPPLQGVADPALWRDLWARSAGAGPAPAAPAPDQIEPIDLSVKPPQGAAAGSPSSSDVSDEQDLCIDVMGVDEPLKSVVPLDLTLDRQSGTDVVTLNRHVT